MVYKRTILIAIGRGGGPQSCKVVCLSCNSSSYVLHTLSSYIGSLLCLIQWRYLPESPRWLIANGRHEEARSVLAKFHTGGEEQHPLINLEMSEITEAIEIDESAKETKWSALLARQNRKRVLITFLLGFFSQWVVRLGLPFISYSCS